VECLIYLPLLIGARVVSFLALWVLGFDDTVSKPLSALIAFAIFLPVFIAMTIASWSSAL
jgi:hypothetical protein